MKEIIFYELLNFEEVKEVFSDTRIKELLQGWLDENGVDVLVSILNLGSDHVSLNIDYFFDKNKDVLKIQNLTEMFLDKLHIKYKLEAE